MDTPDSPSQQKTRPKPGFLIFQDLLCHFTLTPELRLAPLAAFKEWPFAQELIGFDLFNHKTGQFARAQ